MYIDEKTNRWVCPEGKASHYFDCEYMNFVAADILRLKTRSTLDGGFKDYCKAVG